MLTIKRRISLAAAATTLAAGVAGCGQDDVRSKVDDAGKSVEQIAPKARERGEAAARDARKAARGAADDAARQARRKLEDKASK